MEGQTEVNNERCCDDVMLKRCTAEWQPRFHPVWWMHVLSGDIYRESRAGSSLDVSGTGARQKSADSGEDNILQHIKNLMFAPSYPIDNGFAPIQRKAIKYSYKSTKP